MKKNAAKPDSDSEVSNSEVSQGTGDEKERFKIIYVDDVHTSLLTLKRRLSGRHDVYPAESSEKMFNVLEKITPDIILLDINMPDIDGYEVIKTLKADERYAQIPVIFFTSNNDRESVVQGLSLGAVDYIIKPFETINMIRCIEKHVAASRAEKEKEKKEEDNRQRILAIDDVVGILKTIQKILCNDYKVHTISKPEAVIAFLKLRKPDLILLDYFMPMYNGFELMTMIRELPGYKDTPVIMLTSEGTIPHIKEAVHLGACDYIVKPFKESELKEKVAKHINAKQNKETETETKTEKETEMEVETTQS